MLLTAWYKLGLPPRLTKSQKNKTEKFGLILYVILSS